MPGDEMVEKVARAIFRAAYPEAHERAIDKHWPEFAVHARAALSAALTAEMEPKPVGYVDLPTVIDEYTWRPIYRHYSPDLTPLYATPPSPPSRDGVADEIAAIAESLREKHPMEASRILILLGKAQPYTAMVEAGRVKGDAP